MKYKQRGYMDDYGSERGAGHSGGGGQRPPGERPSGPRGRGLGKPTLTVFRCAVCGHRQSFGEVALAATCEKCGKDLHTCTHCRHFDTATANECRQPVSEYVSSKAKRNSCELFAAKATQEFAADRDQPAVRSSKGKAAFDALFDF